MSPSIYLREDLPEAMTNEDELFLRRCIILVITSNGIFFYIPSE